jgi:HlyD family secretion protein
MKKSVVIFFVISVVLAFTLKIYFKKPETRFTLVDVLEENISQEISETGQIKKGEKVTLGFKSSGIIENIYVSIGEKIKAGDVLAKLENDQLKIQLDKAIAGLSISQSQLDKLLRGATPEEIQLLVTGVNNAKTSLASAEQSFKDIKDQGEENQKASYEDALSVLNNSCLRATNAFNTVSLIQRTYFNTGNQASFEVDENKDKIEESINEIQPYLNIVEDSGKYESIDTALLKTKESLSDISVALKDIRESCEGPNYKDLVSSADKASLDARREYINLAITNTLNAQQTISLIKLTNIANINSYQSQINSAQGQLEIAENTLAQTTAVPREEDISYYKAQVLQAEAGVKLIREQIEDSILRGPIDGQIIQIQKRLGETAQLATAVMSLIPEESFQVEVDIPEVSIGKIGLGNICKITLDSFPEQEFSGKVIDIEPAETILSGVVYYRAKVSLNAEGFNIKTGMTANVIIIANSKENVLVVPQRAVLYKDGKRTVRIPLDDYTFKEVEVKVGLKGSNGMVEILSGLNKGDKVITFIKTNGENN